MIKKICFHSKRLHTITKMNDNINMDITIYSWVNEFSHICFMYNASFQLNYKISLYFLMKHEDYLVYVFFHDFTCRCTSIYL
jgi:hypothetical protein